MPTYQTKGIVIGRTNFGEADRVIRFFTPGNGKLSAVAKGVRKIKSRSGGHLELLGEVDLMLASGRNLDVVTSARLLWYPHRVASSYEGLGLAFALTSAVDHLTQIGHPHPEIYKLLLEALHEIDEGTSGALLELWFKLRLLNLLGYHPELGRCIVCGAHQPDANYLFSIEKGGIVCSADADATARPIGTSAIKLWRLLSDYTYVTIALISDAASIAADTLDICDGFYEHHLGRAFRPTVTGEAK